MKKQQNEQVIYWLLLRIAIRSRHDFARLAEQKFDLTLAQLYVLCLINPDSPEPMNNIASQLLCDASNVTGIVDRLASQGFIERKDSTQDRRVKVITLTRKGKRLRSIIMSIIATIEPEGLQKLSPAERHIFYDLLNKVLT